MSENNLSLDLDGFVWTTRLSKNLSVVYMYAHQKFNSDVSAHS